MLFCYMMKILNICTEIFFTKNEAVIKVSKITNNNSGDSLTLRNRITKKM